MDRLEADRDEPLDLVIEEPALGPDEERDRPRDPMGTGGRRARMRDEAAAPGETGTQHVRDQRLEVAQQLDRRKHAVPRLLEAEQQALADRVLADVVALPEALLRPRGADDADPLDPEARRRGQQPPEDRRARQREHELERPLGRRILVELQRELEGLGVEGEDASPADPPADDPDAQLVSRRRAQDLLRVAPTSPADPGAAGGRVPLLRFDEQAVQDGPETLLESGA